MEEQVDEVTGLSRKVIIESRDPDKRPRITIKDESGKTVKIDEGTDGPLLSYRSVPTSTYRKTTIVNAGDVIAKIPRETTKTKDITGGLPQGCRAFRSKKAQGLCGHF